jgi:hypothetical protein
VATSDIIEYPRERTTMPDEIVPLANDQVMGSAALDAHWCTFGIDNPWLRRAENCMIVETEDS